jgi:AbrB family looped-hinge helix DNA binding protein
MKVTKQGQVTIPQSIREALGLLPGTEVEFTMDGDGVLLRKVQGARARGRALVEHMRGRASGGMSTDEIMVLTRAPD